MYRSQVLALYFVSASVGRHSFCESLAVELLLFSICTTELLLLFCHNKLIYYVDARTILRLHRIARITLSSEIKFNVWSIYLGDFVDHNIQPV